jgi:hypothetical protein
MKVLFFLISLVGAAYLIVSSLELDVFNMSPKNTLTSNERLTQKSDKLASAETGTEASNIALALAKIDAIQASYQIMQSKIEGIEKTNQSLETQLANLQSNKLKPLSSQPVQSKPLSEPDSHSSSVQLASASPVAPYLKEESAPLAFTADNEAQSNLAAISRASEASLQNNENSAQNKRLQQQALLRDLAQKRQFAAIDALQTSAR